MQAPHIPVLTNEVAQLFSELNEGVFIDCTLGYGGHAFDLLSRFERLKYIGIDRDQTAIDYSKNRLETFADHFSAIRSTFGEAIKTIKTPIAGVLADLGVSSLQFDDKSRGFSFESESLDMRMDKSAAFSANDVINGYGANELKRVFIEYGEEKNAAKIADLIVKNRPIKSAKVLADLIASRFARGKIHSATKIFQAVRIEVNSELNELKTLLKILEEIEPNDAIIAVISFHSLEDRIVKDCFKKWATNCVCSPNVWRCECGGANAIGRILTKKPITASAKEIKQNPRSRSAKLRAFKFSLPLS
ncbi:MAG: 16S rRNA (cytosine(1402)-N(4))-methyltransferase RsmH [Helicobacteraceae bacterium]|jgi:16S rRNA (cytosine1402-N4)-methyltransferase|nr:16S rRNA (cytosine(1402)-N(4))-methyltransferase RsmH [Helicobacteraceae bacterium]